jgi:3-oxoadipate enol-lactonase
VGSSRHGRSGSPDGTCVLGDLAADLVAILDDAAIVQGVVLGHSAGSVIALQFALDYPARAAGLILVGAASECDTAAHRFYEEVAQLAENEGMDPVRQRLGLRRERDTASEPTPITFAQVARCMGNLHLQPLTPRLHEIHCPTLICVGEQDVFGVDPSVVLSRGIAGAHLEIVPGRGHGLFLEDPEGFNHIVDGFLRTLPLPSRTPSGDGSSVHVA